jgi:hypothetical protein
MITVGKRLGIKMLLTDMFKDGEISEAENGNSALSF